MNSISCHIICHDRSQAKEECDRTSVENLVQKAIAYFEKIDVLVNDAGIYYMGPAFESLARRLATGNSNQPLGLHPHH